MPHPLLEIKEFQCISPDGRSLFHPRSFSLNSGEMILVNGGSGTGKTSLLFGIRGISFSNRTYRGEVLFRGEPISFQNRKKIGLVLQNPHSQILSTLVREELEDNAEEAIEILGLRYILNMPIRNLSAGQKHLVSIAAIGKGNFPVVMMDEPFLYLDQGNMERALCYIDHLRNQGKGIIVTSHPGVVHSDRFTLVLDMASQDYSRTAGFLEIEEPQENLNTDEKEALLELENADIGYAGYPPFLKGVTLRLKRGEELWVYGRNASGKTTLLKAISGEEQLVINGEARVISPERKKPYIITQNPDRFFFESTVLGEMVSPVFFREEKQEKMIQAKKEAIRILETFTLSEKRDLSPPQLSFGERLRLAAAQAALLKPDFIIIDDVLAFLGEKERRFFMDILRWVKDTCGCGLLIATSQVIPSLMRGQKVICLNGDLVADAGNALGYETGNIPLEKNSHRLQGLTHPDKRKKRGVMRLLRRTPFEYIPSQTLVHRIPGWIKLIINILFWIAIMMAKPVQYPYIALLGLIYYLGGGLGIKRLFADAKFFILQAFFFCIILAIFRWDVGAWKTGLVYGFRVWLFFLPMAVMMRTTTTDEWMALFGKILSTPKRIVLGISMGLLPVIVSELGEVVFIQRQKGFVLKRGDILKPSRVWRYSKSLLVPMVIITEDLAHMAEVAILLDEKKNGFFTREE